MREIRSKQLRCERIHLGKLINSLLADGAHGLGRKAHFTTYFRDTPAFKEEQPDNSGLPRFQKRHIVFEPVYFLLQRHKAADKIIRQGGIGSYWPHPDN